MNFWVCGLNYKTAAIEQRESLALAWQNQAEVISSALAHAKVGQIALTVTCNRIECYIIANEIDTWLTWLHHNYGFDKSWFEAHGYILSNDRALEHILKVAVGIDSMVLGENQILGQLKKSYNLATQLGAVSGSGHSIFSWLFKSAKHIRTASGLCNYTVSVASIAVNWLKNKILNWQDLQIMVVGSGETAQLMTKYLQDAGCKNFFIASRTITPDNVLVKQLAARIINPLDLAQYLPEIDIVITATNCPVPFIDLQLLQNIKISNKLYLLDLAMPRNINPNVVSHSNIELINLDQLADIAKLGQAQRLQAAIQAEYMVQDAVKNYSQQNAALVVEYRQNAEKYLHDELTKGIQLLKNNHNPERVLETVCQNLLNKLMHIPTIWLKQTTQDTRETMHEAVD